MYTQIDENLLVNSCPLWPVAIMIAAASLSGATGNLATDGVFEACPAILRNHVAARITRRGSHNGSGYSRTLADTREGNNARQRR